MAIERVGRKDFNNSKIKAIENALHGMLEELNDELENAVTTGKVDKDQLGTILSKMDTLIIEDPEIQGYLLSTEGNSKAKVQELIQDTQDAIKETIQNFMNDPDRKNLTTENFREVAKIYKEKVEGSATVKRTEALEEYYSKVDLIALATAKSKLEEIETALSENNAKLQKIEFIKPGAGENYELAKARIISEVDNIKFDDTPFKKIEKIQREDGYKYEEFATKIGVENYNYSVPENTAEVAEFLKQLSELKEGNPNIEKIFEDLKHAGIVPEKDGNFNLNFKGKKAKSKINALRSIVNKRLQDNPINFEEAKANTCNAQIASVDADINAVLKLSAMKLHPLQMKVWETEYKDANLEKKLAIWADMKKFMETHDLKKEVEDIDVSKKPELEAEKATLEARKKKFESMLYAERFAEVKGNLKTLSVNGSELEVADPSKDILSLSGDDLKGAITKLYQENKEEMLENFYKYAPAKEKKVGILERIVYAIQHRTLSPKKAILAQRASKWSKQQISLALVEAGNKKTQAAMDALEFGALDQKTLEEVKAKQAKMLEEQKGKQAKAILTGDAKSADEAIENVKKQADNELEM